MDCTPDHYAGLVNFVREMMNSAGIPVWCTPDMGEMLRIPDADSWAGLERSIVTLVVGAGLGITHDPHQPGAMGGITRAPHPGGRGFGLLEEGQVFEL
jgi:hypothetical protein